MPFSRPARLMAGVTLITVPTIVYGGRTMLAVIHSNAHALAPAPELSPSRQTLFRAGHAHTGVMVLLSLA